MSKFTKGPWEAATLINAETGHDFTPDEIGEYVKNTFIKSHDQSGSTKFLAVLCNKVDGPADVCHVGNGPTSPHNARLIAAAPEMYDLLVQLVKENEMDRIAGIMAMAEDLLKEIDG